MESSTALLYVRDKDSRPGCLVAALNYHDPQALGNITITICCYHHHRQANNPEIMIITTTINTPMNTPMNTPNNVDQHHQQSG